MFCHRPHHIRVEIFLLHAHCHRCHDAARTEGVAAHVDAGTAHRDIFGHANHCRLACHISHTAAASVACHTGNIHNRAGLFPDHHFCRLSCHVERALGIDVDQCVNCFISYFFNRFNAAVNDTRIVYQNIHRAKGFKRFSDHGTALCLV